MADECQTCTASEKCPSHKENNIDVDSSIQGSKCSAGATKPKEAAEAISQSLSPTELINIYKEAIIEQEAQRLVRHQLAKESAIQQLLLGRRQAPRLLPYLGGTGRLESPLYQSQIPVGTKFLRHGLFSQTEKAMTDQKDPPKAPNSEQHPNWLEDAAEKVKSITSSEYARKRKVNQLYTQTTSIADGISSSGGYKVWKIDGIIRKVPPNWEFPFGPILEIYKLWHHGEANNGIAPMKYFVKTDVSWKEGKRWTKSLSEVRGLCAKLDEEAERLDLLKQSPDVQDTERAFFAAKDVFGLDNFTPTGRPRDWSLISWGTVIRDMSRQKGGY